VFEMMNSVCRTVVIVVVPVTLPLNAAVPVLVPVAVIDRSMTLKSMPSGTAVNTVDVVAPTFMAVIVRSSAVMSVSASTGNWRTEPWVFSVTSPAVVPA
jgi:hypothetical protein